MIKVLKILSVAIAFFLLLTCYFLLFFVFFPTADIGWFLASVVIIYLIGHFLYDNHENSKWKKKLLEIALSRQYLSKADYMQIVQKKEYNPDDIDACYDITNDYFKARWGNIDFSIYPEDDIFRLYRFDDEDITDNIEELFKKLGLTWLRNIEFNELNVKHSNIVNVYYLLDVIKIARNSQSNK